MGSSVLAAAVWTFWCPPLAILLAIIGLILVALGF